MARKFTTEDFITKAKEVHGDKYDYSKVEYVNANDKVCIICPEHGEFWQSATHHIHNHGCPKCSYKNKSEKYKYSTEEIIVKARVIHGDKYDYSKSKYNGMHKKMLIICPEHGEFTQTPANHIGGTGCPKCVGKRLTTEDFVTKSKLVHGNKYDYSKTEYVNSTAKICKNVASIFSLSVALRENKNEIHL